MIRRLLASTVGIIALVALGYLGVMRVQGWLGAHDAAWQGKVDAALEERDVERERADSLVATERAAAQQAAALLRVNQELVQRGERVRTVIERVPVPAEAEQYTAPRDSLIAILDARNALLERVVVTKDQELDATRADRDLWRGQAERFGALLEDAPKERWWMPVVVIGGAVGVNAQSGEAFYGPAVSVGLKLKIL